MIVLDTNVVSEPIKPHGHPAVQAWLDAQVAETLYLTATSLSELLVGIQILPVGKRRDGLASALNELLAVLFANRILPFNREAAVIYAAVVARARASGHQISVADAQIAAIAEAHSFSVASRDTAPFVAAGVRVINPWKP